MRVPIYYRAGAIRVDGGGVIDTEFLHDRLDNFAGMRNDGNDDRPFVRLGRLQRLELAVEQARRHEMIGACGDPLRDQVAVALQENEPTSRRSPTRMSR